MVTRASMKFVWLGVLVASMASCSVFKGSAPPLGAGDESIEEEAIKGEPVRPAVNIVELVERENFEVEGDQDLHGIGERWVNGVYWARFDVTGPPTLLIQVWDYVGEGGWGWELHAFDVTDPDNPRALRTQRGKERSEAILTGGGYMDLGYLRVVDLDGDGKDEIVDVGQTDGFSISPLKLWFWNEAKSQLEDRVWRQSAGVDYVILDLDGDLISEVVGFSFEDETAGDSSEVNITVLRADKGYWKKVEAPDPSWAKRAALSAFLSPAGRVEYIYALASPILKHHGPVDAKQLAKIQSSLEERYAELPSEQTWKRGAVLSAMGIPGNEKGAAFLTQVSRSPEGQGLRQQLCVALYRTQDDGAVTRAFEMLEESITNAIQNIIGDGIIQAMFIETTARKDPRATELFEELYKSADTTGRSTLIRSFYSMPSELAGLMSDLLDSASEPDEISALIYLFMTRTRSYQPHHQIWLDSLDPTRLAVLAVHPDIEIRKQGLILFAESAPEVSRKIYIEALRDERNVTILSALLDNFPKGANPAQLEGLTASLKFVHKLRGKSREVDHMMHLLIARQGHPELVEMGIGWLRDPDSARAYVPRDGMCAPKHRERLVDLFIKAIEADPENTSSRSYYEALGRCGNKRRLEEESNLYTKATIVEALGNLDAKETTPLIEEVMLGNSDDLYLSEAASKALVRFGTKESREVLERLVQPPERTDMNAASSQRIYLRALGQMLTVEAFEDVLSARREKWSRSLAVGCQNIMRELGVLGEVHPMRGSKALLAFVAEDKCQGKEEDHLVEVFEGWVRHPTKGHPEALKLWFDSPISREVRLGAQRAHNYIEQTLEMKAKAEDEVKKKAR